MLPLRARSYANIYMPFLSRFHDSRQRTVLVGNRDFAAVVAPLERDDGRLLPVVDHLLEPGVLVRVTHPHDDETGVVARRELHVNLVPADQRHLG